MMRLIADDAYLLTAKSISFLEISLQGLYAGYNDDNDNQTRKGIDNLKQRGFRIKTKDSGWGSMPGTQCRVYFPSNVLVKPPPNSDASARRLKENCGPEHKGNAFEVSKVPI
jgi:hypothetical protein